MTRNDMECKCNMNWGGGMKIENCMQNSDWARD